VSNTVDTEPPIADDHYNYSREYLIDRLAVMLLRREPLREETIDQDGLTRSVGLRPEPTIGVSHVRSHIEMDSALCAPVVRRAL
jgi:hypothetical protein